MFGINKSLKIHFIGIGGIGMSGIAQVLVNLGYCVSGSDINENENVLNLKEQGVTIHKGHDASNISGVQIVVYSSAINYDNPEFKTAIEQQIPIIKRAEMLAELMRLKYGIAIAGSHGKTTTTSFVSTIFEKCDQRPTCIVGGIVKNLGGQAVSGDSEYLIAEADESDGSFLFLNPIMSVITNIDNDHMDYYKTEDNIKQAFEEFANKIPFYGVVALNANDKNSSNLIGKLRKPHCTYGISKLETYVDDVDFLAIDIKYSEEDTCFTLVHKEQKYPVCISLSGDHNIQNALAAIAISHKVGLSLENVCRAISSFQGVGRRFEILFNNNKFVLVDDYGHHPTELKATINTAKTRYPNKKIVVVFEPHRFSRTKEFWNEFIDCFKDVEKAHLAPIYPASEKPIVGIDSKNLVNSINEKFSNAQELTNWGELEDLFETYENQDVVLLSMGAGSISKTTREKMSKWKA